MFRVCIFRCYDRSRRNSCSGMQCRQLSVWSVYFNFNALTCQNYIFPEGMGVYIKHVEIPVGWGWGYFCVQNMKNLGRRGGACMKFLCGGGMDIFWNYATEFEVTSIQAEKSKSSSCPRKNFVLSCVPLILQRIASVKVWNVRTGFRLAKFILYRLPYFPAHLV